jgi:hypothetical protein
MITDLITEVISAAVTLLGSLGTIFTGAVDLVYDTGTDVISPLGNILLATAGFALAWSGIRFVFGFVNRMLNKSRAGR